jgi:hypothetical protein
MFEPALAVFEGFARDLIDSEQACLPDTAVHEVIDPDFGGIEDLATVLTRHEAPEGETGKSRGLSTPHMYRCMQ